MFIINSNTTIPTVKTNYILGKYLVKHGLPLLQTQDNKMVFSKTNRLEEIMNDLPISLKLFGRANE